MYLKRIEAYGFKSFADKTIINFEPGIIGVVGPNGSGKSNISDSIKWVLGESSMKSLRGKSSDDIIFAGSDGRPALNMAEVYLVFDNSKRTLNVDYNEVEVGRRVYRGSGENEYFLNREHCRKKDITDLLMDTGLGKDSLALISQGTVSKFAEAKPEDRRALFEEAAGVAKYKARKIESLRKLERTTENLQRIADIVKELSRQIAPLKRQSEKAIIYKETKEELEKIEVGFIVEDVKKLVEEETKLNTTLKNTEDNLIDVQLEHDTKEAKLEVLNQKAFEIDKETNKLQGQLMKAGERITSLESQKLSSDTTSATSQDAGNRIEKLKEKIISLNADIKSYSKNVDQAKLELSTILDKLNYDYEAMSKNRAELNKKQSQLAGLESRRNVLKDQLDSKQNLHYGVRSILKNINALTGVNGIVQDIVDIQAEYQVAFSSFMGGTAQNVIVKTVSDAKKAVNFLKQNRAGKATFLPLNGLNVRGVREDMMLALKDDKGFVGIASDLLKYPKENDPAIKFLYGTTIIAESLDDAARISKLVAKRYRIVSLDGEVINPGGSITGGNTDKNQNAINARTIEIIEGEINSIKNITHSLREGEAKLDLDVKESRDVVQQKRISIAKYEEILASKEYTLNLSNDEYEKLSGEKLKLEELESGATSSITEKLNDAIWARNNITEKLQTLRTQRLDYSNEINTISRSLKELRMIISKHTQTVNDCKVKLAKITTTIESHLLRLNEEYKLTFDHAKDNYTYKGDFELARRKIRELRTKIEDLGNVNLDSIEEYKNVSERFETLTTQKEELESAQKKILSAIDEMDAIMITNFKEIIENINIELKTSFQRLFGGGSAKIDYTDPSNILESGIEVNVQPPGKKITNLNLFSGGEKSLIALSVLFAILKTKPLPLCFLDEVEAPLDQANVERFAKYLRDFVEETQFIVITHRPGTMEQCDMLYGVTMQTKGCTKMVSVKLDEAEQLID